MKTAEWKTYRTRFLIKAKQLNSSLSFVDDLGRQHSGRKGDYLVESWDGVVSIAPRQIFEDVYVAMGWESAGSGASPDIETRAIRKSPQPCHPRRIASPSANLWDQQPSPGPYRGDGRGF
jgi:hypothetical protein